MWGIGLLRADLVTSDKDISIPGLVRLENSCEFDTPTYCDRRVLEHREGGYGSSLSASALEGSPILSFHPSRILVLYHVKRTLRLESTNTQYLNYEDGVIKIAEHMLAGFRRWTSSIEFGQRFDHWNAVSEIVSISEPSTFSVVHSGAVPPQIPCHPRSDFEQRVRDFLVQLGISEIRQMLQALAFNAETLDDNRSLHVLVRLMKPREREKLKGHIGCAMQFLSMAETIRRAAEAAFGQMLPEEDEIGPGTWFPGARKMLYGSDRVFDSSPAYLRDYLSILGLDFGIKVRCYVEGSTELGAIDHAIEGLGHVQRVNLAGRFVERGGKGLAFAQSLEADKKAGIFSIIILDGDLREQIRIVQRAAESEAFAGSFFIASPDFECGNFSGAELIDVAVSLSQLYLNEPQVAIARKEEMLKEAASIRSNHDLIALLRLNGIDDFKKDERWGKALMARAIAQPTFGMDDKRGGTKREIIEAVETIFRAKDVGFQRSVDRERVDPSTGRSVGREETQPASTIRNAG